MQGIYDAIFGNVTAASLTAAMLFGGVVFFSELRKLQKEIESVRELQGRIAAKVEELERKMP